MRKRFDLTEVVRCTRLPFIIFSADGVSIDTANSRGMHGKKSKKTTPDRLYLNLRTVYY